MEIWAVKTAGALSQTGPHDAKEHERDCRRFTSFDGAYLLIADELNRR
jgi:hypothetical protein